jgi:hypothetical protein
VASLAHIRAIICMQTLTRNIEGMGHFKQLCVLAKLIRRRVSKKQGEGRRRLRLAQVNSPLAGPSERSKHFRVL